MSTLLPGNIIYSGPLDNVETQNFRSLGHYVLEKLKSFGDKILMINPITLNEYTGKMLYDSVVRLAQVLQRLGVKSGDVVGVSSENRYEYAVTLYACFAVNATVAPLNVTYSEREVHHAVNLSKPKLFFASKITIDCIAKVARNNNFIKQIIVYDSEKANSKILAYKDLMQSRKIVSKPDFFPPIANKYEDTAFIVCSSGTTGLPKGVQLTQTNILAALDFSLSEIIANSTDELMILAVIPWFHVFGCLTLINSAVTGTTLVYLPKFQEHDFLGAIEKYRITAVFMVPPLMVFLAKSPVVDKYNLSSLKVLFCGAAPLSKETEDQIKARIGVPYIRQGYGLSETTRGVVVQSDNYCKPGSVGGVKRGVYAKVVDPKTGKTLGANQQGELCFKGDYVMKGYIGDVKSTQAIIRDGWLHTGDIGYFDDDLEIFVVDRIKELIKYKGYQVPPAEIEALLLTNPNIKDAAVIGKPDEKAGELPMAFVVKQAGAQPSEREVMDFIAERASAAKRLRGGVIFVDEIPKNPSGKILRRVLRDMLKRKLKSKL